MNARLGLAVGAFFVLGTCAAAAQEAAAGAPAAEGPAGWEFNASVYGYFPPEDLHYAQPTVTADRGALHLEAPGRHREAGGERFDSRNTLTGPSGKT